MRVRWTHSSIFSGENPFTNQRINCGVKIYITTVPTSITAVITVMMMENVFSASA